mmetsp:Transcript_52484/g.152794  ORF Transcript_52484/g.152794 Transcript_52484/m.152794 type:complete len:336 (+) Transcript_52484:578-1585(+)
MKRRLVSVMSDMVVSLEDISVTSPSEAEVLAVWSGTQLEEFVPLFPCGTSACWHVRLCFTFDASFKVKAVDVRFVPTLTLLRQPSNFEGLVHSALQLASTPTGSRMLQAGIENTTSEAQALLLRRKSGHVWEVSVSPHGNHVLQLLITTAPYNLVACVAGELRGRAISAAKHVTRSRVLERLFEQCPPDVMAPIAEELLPCAAALSKHRFGNFVIQRMIEHGGDALRRRVVQQLAPQAFDLACCQHGNSVIGAAIRQSAASDQELLIQGLAAGAAGVPALLKHRNGSFVVRQMKQAGLYGAHAGMGKRAQAATNDNLAEGSAPCPGSMTCQCIQV